MPGTFSPAADFKENRLLAIPACITARAWRTCRDACRDRLHAVTGKTFPAFPAHAHPQFYVSGKRPMIAKCNGRCAPRTNTTFVADWTSYANAIGLINFLSFDEQWVFALIRVPISKVIIYGGLVHARWIFRTDISSHIWVQIGVYINTLLDNLQNYPCFFVFNTF